MRGLGCVAHVGRRGNAAVTIENEKRIRKSKIEDFSTQRHSQVLDTLNILDLGGQFWVRSLNMCMLPRLQRLCCSHTRDVTRDLFQASVNVTSL